MATERISRFFERLGFKLRNERNSWGGTNNDAVLLRSWDDEIRQSPRRVLVLAKEERAARRASVGRNERKAHLRAIWGGGIPAYTVIATPKFDKTTNARSIDVVRPDVFPIVRLVEEDELIFAVLGTPVSSEALPDHMQSIGRMRVPVLFRKLWLIPGRAAPLMQAKEGSPRSTGPTKNFKRQWLATRK